MHRRGITRYRVLVRPRTQTRLSCMSGIRPPATYHNNLQPMLSASAQMYSMMLQLQQWTMQYGCPPMHQYPIPYAGPPHVHCRGMIDMQGPEWTGANVMPPGLGHERDAASDVSPHKALKAGRASDGMCSTFANNTAQRGSWCSSESKEMGEHTAVLQTVANKDMGSEPFSNIILRLAPLTFPISQAAYTHPHPFSMGLFDTKPVSRHGPLA